MIHGQAPNLFIPETSPLIPLTVTRGKCKHQSVLRGGEAIRWTQDSLKLVACMHHFCSWLQATATHPCTTGTPGSPPVCPQCGVGVSAPLHSPPWLVGGGAPASTPKHHRSGTWVSNPKQEPHPTPSTVPGTWLGLNEHLLSYRKFSLIRGGRRRGGAERIIAQIEMHHDP